MLKHHHLLLKHYQFPTGSNSTPKPFSHHLINTKMSQIQAVFAAEFASIMTMATQTNKILSTHLAKHKPLSGIKLNFKSLKSFPLAGTKNQPGPNACTTALKRRQQRIRQLAKGKAKPAPPRPRISPKAAKKAAEMRKEMLLELSQLEQQKSSRLQRQDSAQEGSAQSTATTQDIEMDELTAAFGSTGVDQDKDMAFLTAGLRNL